MSPTYLKNRRARVWMALVVILAAYGHTQGQGTKQAYGQWLMYFGDNHINDRIGIHTEAQLRNYMLRETAEQTLLRVGLNWYTRPEVMISAGYGYIYTAPTAQSKVAVSSREQRIWQQWLWRQRFENIALEHRYRLEQRFISALPGEESTLDHRIRYRLMATLPLKWLSPKLNRYYLAGYNELFIHLGRPDPAQYFDRNRLYLALGYQVKTHMHIQLGYLTQVISIHDIDQPEVNHNLQVAVFLNMEDVMHPFARWQH